MAVQLRCPVEARRDLQASQAILDPQACSDSSDIPRDNRMFMEILSAKNLRVSVVTMGRRHGAKRGRGATVWPSRMPSATALTAHKLLPRVAAPVASARNCRV